MTRRPHPAWCIPIAIAAFVAGAVIKPPAAPAPAPITPARAPDRSPAQYQSDHEEAGDTSPTVYITRTGTKYHRATCQYAKTASASTLDQAKARGLTPCSKCKP